MAYPGNTSYAHWEVRLLVDVNADNLELAKRLGATKFR
jgi:hypothetical protein